MVAWLALCTVPLIKVELRHITLRVASSVSDLRRLADRYTCGPHLFKAAATDQTISPVVIQLRDVTDVLTHSVCHIGKDTCWFAIVTIKHGTERTNDAVLIVPAEFHVIARLVTDTIA